jgi:hypothetical protein
LEPYDKDVRNAGLGAHLTARTWRQFVQASAVPGYGYRYRRWVLDSLRYIDVQDLATGGDHIQELDDVYVDVALVSRAPHLLSGPLGPAAEETSERQSIGGILDRRSPVALVLVGQPGSGKSTLLAHAARRSAGALSGLHPGRRRVPVLLALREQAERVVANPELTLPAVIRAAVTGVPGGEPAGWWERQLRGGRCLVLLDGLDEVARADDRLAVADWVERQIAAYPGNHFVITSRSYGLPSTLIAETDVLVVRPFTAEQVRLFLDRWYQAAERHATGATGRAARRAVRLRARESAARLLTLLREHPALHDLAFNPLLLTMTATAHRYRGALPGSRADLYGEMCQVLLSRRVQAKDLPELLPWPAKQALLATLAYQMTRDHVSELPAGRVLEILGPQLKRFPASVTGEAFLDDIAHNGLLVETQAGQYSFTHLTFQEYLTARHISATPELVQSLADNVSNPWWHETILLYAATSDASPIVRACLDSGTIPALTLAFDCDDASAEIDPDLRQRLDYERRRAYEPGCSPAHRRLIAGVQAARLVRQTLTTDTGTRICARPVPADLYWLFLTDTQAPQPDSPCTPGTDQPAAGVWGAEAQSFVKWLNSITATATGIEVRLPHHDELRQEAIGSALNWQLPAAVTSAWTQPGPELWLRPGQSHPHELAGAEVRQAIAADAKGAALLPQILSAAVLNVALSITRDLDDVRALSGALASDLAARANSDGQIVDLMHAHAHAIVLTYAHARALTRADAITLTCAAGQDLVAALDLAVARALADAVARDLAAAIDHAHTSAVELAEAIDLDLNVLSAFDFDLTQAIELARGHAAALDRAYGLARGVSHAPEFDLAGIFGIAGVHTLDPALPLPGILGLPLRWVADGPLADTLLQVLAANAQAGAGARPLHGDPYQAFALALCARAGVQEDTRLTASLGRPISDALRDLSAAESAESAESARSADSARSAESARSDGAPDWRMTMGLGRLADASAPMSVAHRPPSAPTAAALRAVALALADSAAARGAGGGESAAPGTLRTVAATVTLVEKRGQGAAKSGESVILALG